MRSVSTSGLTTSPIAVRTVRRMTLRPFATRWVLLIVLAKSAVNLAVAGRYGWHIDELYYRAAGKHPALGHVDFPPITPLLAGLADLLFGPSLVGMRFLAVLAGAGAAVLTALIARELGGGSVAQTVAAAAVASTLLLGSNSMFQTVSFDQLMWAAVLYLAVRLLRTGDARLWPALGVVAGVGLMTKYTIGLLLCSWLFAHRSSLWRRGPQPRRRWQTPWAAAGIAALIVLPNLWWQVRHGWPSVDFLTHQNPGNRAEFPPHVFVPMFLLAAGPLGLGLLVVGAPRLWRDDRFRPLAVAAGLTVFAFVVTGGKPYYPAPLHFLFAAAGAVGLEAASSRARRALLIGAAALTLPAVPYYVPLLPRAAMIDIGGANVSRDYADQIGWPQLVDDIAAVYEVVPPRERERAAILTRNYGEAGAVDLLGSDHGLPRAASPHLTYRYWTPPRLGATWLVSVGFHDRDLDRWCASEAWTTRFTTPYGVENEESGASIAVCRLRGTFADVWRDVTHRT